MEQTKKENFKGLIKENKNIRQVIWKEGSKVETINEARFLKFLKFKNYQVPDVLETDNRKIIMDFIPGISVFKAMQYFYENKSPERIESLVRYLCDGISNFQSDMRDWKEKTNPYPVSEKLKEVFQLLSGQCNIDDKKNKKLITLASEVFDQNAFYIFRDATPKNYIIKWINEKDLPDTSNSEIIEKIVWIDFSTVRYKTLAIDDFASILFHYMVPQKLREDLLNLHNIDIKRDLNNQVAVFVRLARFWVRRYYYSRYYPEHFRRRYEKEDIYFYQKQFEDYLQKMYQIL